MSLNGNRIGRGYRPPLTERDKEIIRDVKFSCIWILGILGILIISYIRN